MFKLVESVTTLAGIAAVVSFAVLVYAGYSDLKHKVETLEERTDLLETSIKSPTASSDLNQVNQTTHTCSELAKEYASLVTDGRPLTGAKPIEEIMEKLGCTK